MEQGYAPRDADGYPYELHHVGQKNDGALAILTWKEHDAKGLHLLQESEITRSTFKTERRNIYKFIAERYSAAA